MCLGVDSFPPNEQLENNIDMVNIAFSALFLIEMVVKVTGMGPKAYIQDRYNIFDALIGNVPCLLI
jgi:Ion transport protein